MTGELIVRQYDGYIVEQRRNDRYTNATSMCRACGKMWADYWRLGTTQDYIGELSASMGIPIDDLVQSKPGNPDFGGGTWVHARVATHLAHWLSPRFAVQVSGWLEDLMTNGVVTVQTLTPIQIIAQIANQMAEQERQIEENRLLALTTASRTDQIDAKTDQIEAKVDALIETRKSAEYDLTTAERSSESATCKTLRASINELVRAYHRYHGVEHRLIWQKLYSEVYYRLNINPQTRAKNLSTKLGKKVTAIEIIEQEGLLGQLYAIASEVLVITKGAVS
jgi:hypothetical protein